MSVRVHRPVDRQMLHHERHRPGMGTGTTIRLDELSRTAASGESKYPFSFRYGGRDCEELLAGPGPRRTVEEQRSDEDRKRTATVGTDPSTGLQIARHVMRSHDFPAIEWLLCFKNEETHDVSPSFPICRRLVRVPCASRLFFWQSASVRMTIFAAACRRRLQCGRPFRKTGGRIERVRTRTASRAWPMRFPTPWQPSFPERRRK